MAVGQTELLKISEECPQKKAQPSGALVVVDVSYIRFNISAEGRVGKEPLSKV